ncbi:hypothetical protein NCAS_0J00670 [Naumovozyma castellii]|uniref:Protein SYM1 n=1 Tax=Naumovozyma castellii TaxID=27288 RepID=G0VKK9_NAUCA|nr:hypothetical protein NCAS_0J00670 [Naumovozyma castellii CBS 4309]CCC72046.1 hypothetical protein NCAS_0J00670 [Naumovozyma castellii CBS 4309]
MKLFNLYNRCLRTHPKTTNAIMTGTLFGVGDISAQILFAPTEQPKQGDEIEQKKKNFDWHRTSRAVIYGSMIFSFIGDKWYKILQNNVKLPLRFQHNKSLSMLYKVSVDQLAFAPLGVPFYFSCMTIMEGGTMKDVETKIKTQWWRTLVTNWCVWPLFQMVNFTWVPLQHRLLAVNVVAIFWNTYLSYMNSRVPLEKQYPVHYPPVVE